VEYILNGYADSLSFEVYRGDSLRSFELYGISLENDDPGIVYNSIGVNGAMLKSYLQCALFAEQLKSLEPDWIIISIGTNEGNTRNFDEASYRSDYISMIKLIRSSVPDAALLLTVPNDSYIQKRYINRNTAVIRDIIYELAKENKGAVWDFYSVMGGLNSAKTWYDNNLMAKDHIHFNKAGYMLKGELFINAFLTSWNEF
jgi:lysophospholipase L1-like esterase